MSSFSYGDFNWFMGEVVDIHDSEMHNRVKVKIHGKHTIENDIDKENLPWCIVATPTSSASTSEIGTLPHGLLVGSQVVGFFTDGKAEQVPMILFSFASKTNGVSDVSKLARGTNDIKNKQLPTEPASPYNASYPDNRVMKTKSGHVIEIDDTNGHERVHVRHTSGTYVQFYPNGNFVKKSINNDFEIIASNKSVWVDGDMTTHVNGNYNITVEGDYNVDIKGNYTTKVAKSTKFDTDGTYTNNTSSNAVYSSKSSSKHTASVILLN